MKIYSIRNERILPERLAVTFVGLVDPSSGLSDSNYESAQIRSFNQTFGPYRGKSALPTWQPPKILILENGTHPKAPLVSLGTMAGTPIISEDARHILENLLVFDSELLPLLGTETIQRATPIENRKKRTLEIKLEIIKKSEKPLTYHLIHHLQKRDCLDLEALNEDPNNDYISYLEKYEFRPETLGNAHFFEIKHHPGYFASETFIKLLEQHDLRGMVWELIWDSENPDYIDERFKPEVWAEIKARKAKK